MQRAAIKKWLFLAAKFSIAAFLLWVLISHSQLNLSLFKSSFDKPFLTLAVIAMFYVMIVIGAWRWYLLNKAQHIDLPWQQTIAPTYFGVAFNNVLPGNVGGDFLRIVYLAKRFPAQKSSVVLSVMTDRVTGLFGIIISVCIGALWEIKTFEHDPTLHAILISCVIISICGLGALFVSLLLPPTLGAERWLRERYQHKGWFAPVLSFLEAMHRYRHSKLVILKCLFLSVGIQVFMVITTLMISSMMNLPIVSPADLAIALAVAQIANLVPLTPGGLGIGEMAFAKILMLLNPGITAAYATIFLGFRFFGIISYLPGVVIYIMNFKLPKESVTYNTNNT